MGKKNKLVSPTLRLQLSTCILSIDRGEFDEDTIRSTFIHIREHAISGSLTREIGDFFAHPERDRGLAHSRIAPIVDAFDRFSRGESVSITIKAISHRAILDDLNTNLAKLGVMTVEEERYLDSALTLFLAMQGMRVALNPSRIVPLSFAVLGNEIAVLCHARGGNNDVVFPVFSMPNFAGFKTVINPAPLAEGWPLIRLRRVNGTRELYQEAMPIVVDFNKET